MTEEEKRVLDLMVREETKRNHDLQRLNLEAKFAMQAMEEAEREVSVAIRLMEQQADSYRKNVDSLELQIETENRRIEGLVNERSKQKHAAEILTTAIRVLKSSRGE